MNDTPIESAAPSPARGRVIALDPGAERTGVAICDETRTSVRPLTTLERMSWKRFVRRVAQLCEEFDAREVVVGLPLNMDGTHGAAAQDAQRISRNLQLTLGLPVHTQDERLTSRAAAAELRAEGASPAETALSIHSRSAALILRDYLSRAEQVAAAPRDRPADQAAREHGSAKCEE